MQPEPANSPGQVLVLFDSTDDALRARVRRLVRQNPPRTVRCVSLWDLRRADDVPAFDRREVLNRVRIELPDGQALEGEQAQAWIDARLARLEELSRELIAA